MELRYYQQDAINALYAHARTRQDNPCIVIPTGGGKTPVIASICRDLVQRWHGRAIVVAHVKELLEQSYAKLVDMAPDLDVGLYSAGLNRKDRDARVVVAGIQSVYKKACDIGKCDIMIVDEAHMIPPDGEGMYQQFIREAKVVNPKMRVVGLTATPYRMTSGWICAKDNILNHICYEIGIRELIAEGYLSPLVSRQGATCDTSSLHKRGGEFVAEESEALMDADAIVSSTVDNLIKRTADRKSVLIFTCGVKHAAHVSSALMARAKIAPCVTGDTSPEDRRRFLAEFKAGIIQYLVNVNVLTTGFDAPNIDCVAMLRPTASPGLYYQMVGRGFRRAEGKANCLVLDYAGNVERLGPVDNIDASMVCNGGGSGGTSEKRGKVCLRCQNIVDIAYDICPECGEPFPTPPVKHDTVAADVGILSTDVGPEEEHYFYSWICHTHRKKDDPNAPPTMRVEYDVGSLRPKMEWVCFEHSGYARAKAETWWSMRSDYPCPNSVADAIEMCMAGKVMVPEKLYTRQDGKWERVVRFEFGEKTKPCRQPGEDDEQIAHIEPAMAYTDEEVPF